LNGYEIVYNSQRIDGSGTVRASCSAGKVVLGGGAGVSTDAASLSISRPAGQAQWLARASGEGSFALTVYAICAIAP